MKIRMKPIVEMDGDEMTRILWEEIKETLLLPFVELETEYYDLGLPNRDRTDDQITLEAARAIKRLQVGVKCATITPNAQRMEEYGLKQMWKSPNATIRAELDGTVFRTPILTDRIKPYVRGWKKPITIARHAYGDVYKAVELLVPGPGTAELVFRGEDGEKRQEVYSFKGPGVLQAMHNREDSIEAFARSWGEVISSASREGTMSGAILRSHHKDRGDGLLHLRFDSLISHDITYVGIIQTAMASGLRSFPVPYAMTNCHNSLCAVGGTINADDHAFGLSAAKRFGGIFVPPNMAVIHQYAREQLAGCGKMILGSDSHTRYGALGTMGFGEGGPELVKQLLGDPYDLARPETVLVWVTGKPGHGVGPHDAAIALCGAVYANGFVKNKILEFAGPGIRDMRNGLCA